VSIFEEPAADQYPQIIQTLFINPYNLLMCLTRRLINSGSISEIAMITYCVFLENGC